MWIIDKVLEPRSDIPILNKYICEGDQTSTEAYAAIYYINSNKCSILVRPLTNNLKYVRIVLFDLNSMSKEHLTIQSHQFNTHITQSTRIHLKPDKVNIEHQQIIPKTIIQTSNSNNIPDLYLYNSIMSFIELNPEYKYFFFDDQDCREFIKCYFSEDILLAYDILVPGAYKADLFRCCYLYINGGCYFDAKTICKEPIRKWINKSLDIILVQDRPHNAFYNAIMLSTPNHPIILKVINETVKRINERYYGECCLCPTGPRLLWDICHNDVKPYIRFVSDMTRRSIYANLNISTNIKIIHTTYKDYYNNYSNIHTKVSYGYNHLWNNRCIYYDDFYTLNEDVVLYILPHKHKDRFKFQISNNLNILEVH